MLDTIKIGGIRYTVLADNRLIDNNRAGEIRLMRAEIAVLPDAAPELLPQTLWHETLHGILHQSGQECDEDAIDVLAYGIVQVLRDNPALVELTCRTR
jgi:hypothetical protein